MQLAIINPRSSNHLPPCRPDLNSCKHDTESSIFLGNVGYVSTVRG